MSSENTNSDLTSATMLDIESKLPVKLKKDLVASAPHFVNLLKKLSEKMDKSGRCQVNLVLYEKQSVEFQILGN